jgi:HPt (histidine-containing phosphotransfer) domain-containing protein
MGHSQRVVLPLPGLDPALPMVDSARLGELVQMATPEESHGLLRELLAMYRAEAVPHLARLTAAWQAGDTKEARREAHYLAGSSANLGLARLASGLRELETQAQDGKLPAYTRFTETLEAWVREACGAYEEAVAKLAGAR